MSWIKLDDQLPLNPKIRALTVEARYLLVTSWCWCAMQTNDGTFPASDMPAVAVLAGVPQNVAEQLYPTLWHPEGFDCEACAEVGQVNPVPSGHVSVHCYLERNESRAQIEERRRKDRQRKARSARESATESERNPPELPGGIPPVSSRPVPTGFHSTRRPGNSRGDAERPDDDEISTAVPAETWDHFAQFRLEQQRPGTVKDPVPWKRSTAQNARTELADQAGRWWHDYELTPYRLAQALVAGQPPHASTRRNGATPT